MQHAFERYAVDLGRAGLGLFGQIPVRFERAAYGEEDGIASLVVHPYNRFGNNVFQILHALVIASRLDIRVIQARGFAIVQPLAFDPRLGLSIDVANAPRAPGTSLVGNFFVPFGFEQLFHSIETGEIGEVLARCVPTLYAPLVLPARACRLRSVALHFRGGDNFTGRGHPIYVQPPASFYLLALEHALCDGVFDRIDLVYEDRSNPALAVVEDALKARGLPFRSESGTLEDDVIRLLEAECLIASQGTFCEAAALLSPKLRSFFGFRGFFAEPLAPFLQSRMAAILGGRDVRIAMIRDAAAPYTVAPWLNTAVQRQTITDFPADALRIDYPFGPGGRVKPARPSTGKDE